MSDTVKGELGTAALLIVFHELDEGVIVDPPIQIPLCVKNMRVYAEFLMTSDENEFTCSGILPIFEFYPSCCHFGSLSFFQIGQSFSIFVPRQVGEN